MEELITKTEDSYHISYRGLEFTAVKDPGIDSYYVTWNNEKFYLDNISKNEFDDLKLLIDDKLDTITRFEDSPNIVGAKLEWFRNGSYVDIRLVLHRRIIKIYLVESSSVNLDVVKADALNILNKLLN